MRKCSGFPSEGFYFLSVNVSLIFLLLSVSPVPKEVPETVSTSPVTVEPTVDETPVAPEPAKPQVSRAFMIS